MAKILPLVLATVLAISAIGISLLSFREGWLTNVSEFTTLLISGVVVIMLGGAGALIYESISTWKKEPIQIEFKLTPSSKAIEDDSIHTIKRPSNQPIAIHPTRFEAWVEPELGLCIGDTVSFNAKFTGTLVNGYLGTFIICPDGTEVGVLDFTTISRHVTRFTKGRLNGSFMNREFEWPWVIPNSAPRGEYEFQIRVHNVFVHTNWWVRFKARLIAFLHDHGLDSISFAGVALPQRDIFRQKVVILTVNERAGSSL